MGAALELIAGGATAPGATQTALTLGAGSSRTVRNAPFDSDVRLLQAWADVQAAGVLRIRSPRLGDNVQGLRFATTISEPKPLLPMGVSQRLYPQDELTIDLSGSAVAGDIENAALLVYYADLPGVTGRFIGVDEVMGRMVNMHTVENTLATGVAGGFSGEEAVTAEFDLFKANTDYALVGYHVSVECCAVRWRGVDTGNLGVGGPGDELGRDYTADWFVDLSRKSGLPCIPVFNSANMDAVLIDAVQDENGADPVVTSIFAELA